MNTLEMIQFVRWAVDEPEEALISDSRIVENLNLSQTHVANLLRLLDQGHLETFADLDTVADQAFIALPTDAYEDGFRRLEKRDGTTTRGVKVYLGRLNETDTRLILTDNNLLASETAFLSGDRIYWEKPFGEAEVGRYRLWYEAKITALLTTAPTVSSAIPFAHHEMICFRAIIFYYAKAEQDPGAWAGLYRESVEDLQNNQKRRNKTHHRQVIQSPDELDSDINETLY